MKSLIFILSTPYIFLAAFMFLIKRGNIYKDYMKCQKFIKKNKALASSIPNVLLYKLVLAEDHRNNYHYGVDPISIFRCIIKKIFMNQLQGGSTIEQQLVRTITKKYQITITRKFKEQIISVMINFSFNDKALFGKIYLAIAYYGYNKFGLQSLSIHEKENSSEIIARLKYPTKRNQKPSDNVKIILRTKYIDNLFLISQKRFS